MNHVSQSADRRVLVRAPTAKDAALTRSLLQSAGIAGEVCPAFADLVKELDRGAAAIVLPEEDLSPDHVAELSRRISAQPAWSEIPIVLLVRSGAASAVAAEAPQSLGNVMLLERPVRKATLLSALRTAIRARERQYQIRWHLEEQARAAQSLRIAERRKDEFLATLGHELRNALAPLVSGLHLLKLAGLKDSTAVRVGGAMERQIHHLTRLVNDLLDLSRITTGLVEVHRESLDLRTVVRDAIEASRPFIDEAGHELDLELPPDAIVVEGDAVRLTQVIANLLTNAAKYTNPGGRIRVSLGKREDRAQISVRDNGIGIDRADLSSIFEIFTQVGRSNRLSQGGLGIGLALVRSLVGLHGGRVEARSEGLGSGSEFLVDLPLAKNVSVVEKAAAPLPQMPRRRILIAEDNRDAAEMLGALLEELGATVMIVHDGRSALNALSGYQPDTVLLDIGMPGMDGYEVARRIRANPAHSGLLLIAVTGWGQERDRHLSRNDGFDHHMLKPLDVEKLWELIDARFSEGVNVERLHQ